MSEQKKGFRFRDLETTPAVPPKPKFSEIVQEGKKPSPPQPEKRRHTPVAPTTAARPAASAPTRTDDEAIKRVEKNTGELMDRTTSISASISDLQGKTDSGFKHVTDMLSDIRRLVSEEITDLMFYVSNATTGKNGTLPTKTTEPDDKLKMVDDWGYDVVASKEFPNVFYYLYRDHVIVYLGDSESFLLGEVEYPNSTLEKMMAEIDEYPDDYYNLDQKYTDEFIQICEEQILERVKGITSVLKVYGYDAESTSELGEAVNDIVDQVVEEIHNRPDSEEDAEDEEDVNPDEEENTTSIDDLQPIEEESMEQPTSLKQYAQVIDSTIPDSAVEDILKQARQARRDRSVQLEYGE